MTKWKCLTEAKHLFDRMRVFFDRIPTRTLEVFIGLGGLALALAYVWVARGFSDANEIPEELSMIGSFSVFFTWGWLGVLWAVREEIPLLTNLHGKAAKIMGLIFAFTLWAFAIFLTSGILSKHVLWGAP